MSQPQPGLSNDALRALVLQRPAAAATPSSAADAAEAAADRPQEPQRTAEDLFQRPPAAPVPWDSTTGSFVLSAAHVDETCDLVAQNPHADLWAESDENGSRRDAEMLGGIPRRSKEASRRLRGDLCPLSLAKAVLDSCTRGVVWGAAEEARAEERCVALAGQARRHDGSWDLGKAQEAAALLARLVEPSQRTGSDAPRGKQRKRLLRAAVAARVRRAHDGLPFMRGVRRGPRWLGGRGPPGLRLRTQ